MKAISNSYFEFPNLIWVPTFGVLGFFQWKLMFERESIDFDSLGSAGKCKP